jgi:hypothetical protein
MNATRILVIAGMAFVALIFGLAILYPYGKWQHERYWEGTIRSVTETELELVDGFLANPEIRELIEERPIALEELLHPILRFFSVRVSQGGRVILDSTNPKLRIDTVSREVILRNGVQLTISRYKAPYWPAEYWNWVGHPGTWLTKRFDTKTIPLLWFSSLIFFMELAWAYRHRARHVEAEVIPLLRELNAPNRERRDVDATQ